MAASSHLQEQVAEVLSAKQTRSDTQVPGAPGRAVGVLPWVSLVGWGEEEWENQEGGCGQQPVRGWQAVQWRQSAPPGQLRMTLEPKQTGQTPATPPCQPEQGMGTQNSSSMVLAPSEVLCKGDKDT